MEHYVDDEADQSDNRPVVVTSHCPQQDWESDAEDRLRAAQGSTTEAEVVTALCASVLKDRLVKCHNSNQIFIWDYERHYWRPLEAAGQLHAYLLLLPMRFGHWASKVLHVRKVYEYVKLGNSCTSVAHFEMSSLQRMSGKLCFLDGVMRITSAGPLFEPGFHPEYFCKNPAIPHKHSDLMKEEMVARSQTVFSEVILKPMGLPSNEDAKRGARYLMVRLALAAFCIAQKRIISYEGPPDCGKSSLIGICSAALPGYTGIAAADNICSSAHASSGRSGGDSERIVYGWLGAHRDHRIVFFSELSAGMTNPRLGNDIMKKISAGRDPIPVRPMYKTLETLYLRILPILLTNETPGWQLVEEAVARRHRLLKATRCSLRVRAGDAFDAVRYFPAINDTTWDERLASVEYVTGFLRLLIDTITLPTTRALISDDTEDTQDNDDEEIIAMELDAESERKYQHASLFQRSRRSARADTPPLVREDSNQHTPNSEALKTQILEVLDFTLVATDKMTKQQVKTIVQRVCGDVSNQMLFGAMKDLSATDHRSNAQRFWLGVKPKRVTDNDD